MNKKELLDSKHFCMMPWIHMHLWPNGNTFPCCIWDSSVPVGRYGKDTSLLDLWNSDKMKELRLNSINDKPTKECSRCYILEESGNEHTLRKSSNNGYQDYWHLVEETKSDGISDKVNMAYLDIRFDNTCNLRCQTCGPELSSAWYEDQVKVYGEQSHPKLIKIEATDKLFEELKPLLLNVKNAYFAGGEPLVCDEHYKILDFWLENNKTDIPINYTTNFTLLTHKKSHVLDYWKQMKNVSVSASLDDSWERGEYLRKGTIWKNIIRNRELMMKECPNIHFDITPTIGAYNVFHFPEFHYEWIINGLVDPNNIRLNILTIQPFQSVKILPDFFKKIIIQRYEQYIQKIQDWAWPRGHMTFNVEMGYRSVIKFMMSEDDSHLIPDFLERAKTIDNVRQEKLLKVYPELKVLLIP